MTAPAKTLAEEPKLQYWTVIRTPLFEILTTLENKIDREKRAELIARSAGTPIWLLTHVRVARRTWEVIEALAVDRKSIALSLEIGAAIPPLARVLCESVFAVIFTFEDVSTRVPWFYKAVWRDISDRHAEFTSAFGTDPKWAAWLKALADQRDGWKTDLAANGAALTPTEIADPTKVKYWPTPGRMCKATTDAARKAKIDYFDARYYGELSARTHLSAAGMLDQGIAVGPWVDDERKRIYFSTQVSIGLTLLFSLVSQLCLDIVPDPALARRIVALWQVPHLGDIAAETYARCFQTELEALAAK